MSSRVAAQAGAALPRPTAVFRLKATARALAAPCREFSHYAIFCRPPWPHGRDEAKIRGLAAQIAMARPGANIPSKNANGGKKQPVDPARLCAPVCGARRSFFFDVSVSLCRSQGAGWACVDGFFLRAPGPAFWRIPVWLPLEAPGLCFAPRSAAAWFCFFSVQFVQCVQFRSTKEGMGMVLFAAPAPPFRRRPFSGPVDQGAKAGRAPSLVQWRCDGLLFPSR